MEVKSNHILVDKVYILLKKLFSGTNTKVYLCFDMKEKLRRIIKILKGNQRFFKSSIIQNEINSLKILKYNESIVKLVDYNLDGNLIKSKNKKVSYIVTEYLEKGEFLEFIKFNKGFHMKIARYYFIKLIDILQTLNNNFICHRDIKPDNLVLDQDYNLKLIDFEFSADIRRNHKEICGTTSYMAPELYNNEEYDGSLIDIFSCGVVLFTMVMGSLPFVKANMYDKNYQKMYYDKEKFWSNRKINSDSFKNIVNLMITPFPEERISIEKIKLSEFYNEDVFNQVQVKNYMHQIWLAININKRISFKSD